MAEIIRSLDSAGSPPEVSPVLLRFSRVSLILAICLSIGGHWAALQSIAWVTMLVQYSQHDSMGAAMRKTLDGDHPCNLCKGISAAKHEEKKGGLAPLVVKPELICTTRTLTLRPPEQDFSFAELEAAEFFRAQSPPTPPPRSQLS